MGRRGIALAACLGIVAFASASSAEPDVPAEVTSALRQAGTISDDLLNKVYRLEHRVTIGNGRQIAMTESFTIRSWLRRPRRAMLMIPAQGSNRSTFNAPFDGYDGGAIMAQDGFFAFTADPEGTGDSTFPADGFSVTYESEAASFRPVADYIRLIRLVSRVDAFGEELGGGAAMELCADSARIRSCTMASMIYQHGSDFFNEGVGGPQFQALVVQAPNGYFTTFPDLYFNVLAGATPDLSSWFLGAQIGTYAAGLYKQDFERLFSGGHSYDPTLASVPGLIIMGERDPNPAVGDTAALAQAYGSATGAGPAAVAIIPAGTHIVRLDAPPHGQMFWDVVKTFVDR